MGRETRCKGRPMLEQREGLHQLVNIEVGMDQRNEWFTRLHLSSPPHPGGIPSIVCDSGSSPAWLASEGKEGLERRSVHLLID